MEKLQISRGRISLMAIISGGIIFAVRITCKKTDTKTTRREGNWGKPIKFSNMIVFPYLSSVRVDKILERTYCSFEAKTYAFILRDKSIQSFIHKRILGKVGIHYAVVDRAYGNYIPYVLCGKAQHEIISRSNSLSPNQIFA